MGNVLYGDYRTWSVNHVIDLIRQEQWQEASGFGDGCCYRGVTTDDDFIFKEAEWFLYHDRTDWNATSYGNLAMVIHYGSQYPHRAGLVNQLKQLCKQF